MAEKGFWERYDARAEVRRDALLRNIQRLVLAKLQSKISEKVDALIGDEKEIAAPENNTISI